MKYIELFIILVVIILLTSCSRDSEPTSPESQKLTLDHGIDSANVILKYGQQVIVNDELAVQFDSVTADSSCPIGAECKWAGDGGVRLKLSIERNLEEVVLHTNLEPKFYSIGDYQIKLIALNPYPNLTGTIKPESYEIELAIKYFVTSPVKPVRLIDENNNSAVQHDMLEINNVSLDKDLIKFNVRYSGGCRIHEFELFAYKVIQKSNPAQVTVILSHNSNKDDCKALITEKIRFDLTTLKNYLKDNYNIRDKVILLLFDPSGKPLHNNLMEYYF